MSRSLTALVVALVLMPHACAASVEAAGDGPPDAEPPMRSGAWIIRNHTCPGGNRTDALHRDDDGRLWVGCGTAAAGYGLYSSEDGGHSWSRVVVAPASLLSQQFRVSSISRGHDGALYVAGFESTTWNMVLRLDTAASPIAASVVLEGASQVGRLFHVGSYRELSDGRAIAEALNSADLLYRPDPSTGPSASSWTVPGSPLYQILDLTVRNDQFVAAGSTIAEPPRVFLPPTQPGAQPYQWTLLSLPTTGWTGEMWGIATAGTRVVAVGVDQDANVGKIYVSVGNPYNNSWIVHDLPDIVGTGGAGTWARGVCMRGQNVVVVGERQPLGAGSGLVVLSVDGGQTFSNITPPGVSSTVSRCVIEPDGTLIVAGSAGFVGMRLGETIFRHGFEG